MKRSILSISFLSQMLIFSLLLTACGGKKNVSDEDQNTSYRVKTEVVKIQPVEQIITLTGTVEPFEKAFISSSIPVRIEKIYKEVGDFVKKGDLLVQMDASNYRQARVQLENLEVEFARLDTLFRIGSISQQQLDQMATQLEVARTAYRNLTENTQLRSPINGVVTGRFYENGEMYSMSPVSGGRAAILTIEVLQPVKVLVNLAEQYFPMVEKNLNVSLALDVYQGKTFEGSVYLKYPTIDAATRTFTVELQFPNKEMLIRPGMFGRVVLGFGELERVVVPDLAVIRQQGTNERYVFVEKNGVVERRAIITGRLLGNMLEVVSGLVEGETVVTAGHTRLLDGSAVQVVNEL